MTKPHFYGNIDLEGLAVKNQLDNLHDILQSGFITEGRRQHILEELKEYEKRYVEKTGMYYVYKDSRGIYTD